MRELHDKEAKEKNFGNNFAMDECLQFSMVLVAVCSKSNVRWEEEKESENASAFSCFFLGGGPDAAKHDSRLYSIEFIR